MGLTVSVLGSCRVHNPLRQLANLGLISLNNYRLETFCHTARETVQKLREANGRLNIPEELWPLVHGDTIYSSNMERADFNLSDVFFVEVSSVRRLTVDNIELQLNFFVENFVKPNSLQEWFLELAKKNRHAPLGNKVSLECNHADPKVAAFASSVAMSMEGSDMIEDMVRKITSYLRPRVVFVGHFDVLKDDHTHVADRVRLNNTLRNMFTEAPTSFIDPSELFNKLGQNVALRDHNHWRSDFEAKAGVWMLRKAGLLGSLG